MTDSTDNAAKPKRNHLDAMLDEAVFSLASSQEAEDQDAIDKLLVDTGFDTEKTNNALDDEYDGFSDFDDFGDFVEPVVESLPALEESAPVLEMPKVSADLTEQDEIDKLLADSGFDDDVEALVEDDKVVDEFSDFADFGDFSEPVVESLPDLEESAPVLEMPEVSTDLTEQDEIDKLLADSGFDDDVEALVEDDKVVDEFSDFADFGDFAEPVVEPLPSLEEPALEIPAASADVTEQDEIDKLLADSGFDDDVEALEEDDKVVDEFSDFDDFAEPVPVLEMPAEIDDSYEFNGTGETLEASKVQQDGAIADVFPDFPVLDEFDDDYQTESPNDAVKNMPPTEKPVFEFDEDTQLAMGKSASDDKDEFLALDEIGDDLFIESAASETLEDEFAKQPFGRNSDTEDDFLLADFDITADSDFSNTEEPGEAADEFTTNDFDFPQDQALPEAPINIAEPEQLTELAGVTAATVVTDNAESEALAQLKAEQERMDKHYKKQLNEAQAKAKKAATFGYVALTTGIVALGLAGGMGWLAFSAKSELSQLSESVTTIKADVDSHTAKSTDQDLTAIKSSVEQLNQKVDGAIEQLKGAPALTSQDQAHMPLAAANLPPAGKVTEAAAKKDVLSKSLNIAPSHVEDLHAPKAPEHNPVDHAVSKLGEASAKPDVKSSVPDITHKSPEPLAENKIAATATPVNKELAAKTLNVKKKPAKINKPAFEKKQSANADWSVNLIAYKQDWYAKSKAAEFSQKGVPVEVIPVEVSGVTWYRLRVGGFNNKAEADAYAARVKKALNLSSVWVGDI